MRTWALLIACVGCGDPGSNPDAPLDTSIDTRPQGTQTGRGTVREWVSPTTDGPVIRDARVCLRGTTPPHCVMTGAQGDYVLDLIPEFANIGLTYEKAGYVRTERLSRTSFGGLSRLTTSMLGNVVAQQKVQDAGGSFPLAGTSVIELRVINLPNPNRPGDPFTPAAGATVTMTPASGTGPVYVAPDGYPDRSLAAISDEGSVMFVNVTPGVVELAVTLPGKSCVVELDPWPGNAPHTVLVPAEPDTLSRMTVFCE